MKELMELNVAAYPGLIRGATAWSEDELGWIPVRMTPQLLDFYHDNENAAIRAACPSGIRIAFRSNSEALAMRLRYLREARPVYAVDIRINQEVIETFSPEPGEKEYAFFTELPGSGEREIEIHLPHLCEIRLQNLALESGCSLRPAARCAERWLFLGDSITQGMTTSCPTAAYPARIAAARNADFVNLAVGGATLHRELGSFVARYDWNNAIVAFGVNDYHQGRPLAEFREDCAKLLRLLRRRRSAPVRLITPIPWLQDPGRNSNGDTLDDFRHTLHEVATAYDGVTVVDGRKLVPAEEACFADGLHPNDQGMACFAKNLLRQL